MSFRLDVENIIFGYCELSLSLLVDQICSSGTGFLDYDFRLSAFLSWPIIYLTTPNLCIGVKLITENTVFPSFMKRLTMSWYIVIKKEKIKYDLLIRWQFFWCRNWNYDNITLFYGSLYLSLSYLFTFEKIGCCFLSNSDLIFFVFTFVVVLEVGDGVFEVLSTSGDTHLGGDDFDKVCFIYVTLPRAVVNLCSLGGSLLMNQIISCICPCRELSIGLLKLSRRMKA